MASPKQSLALKLVAITMVSLGVGSVGFVRLGRWIRDRPTSWPAVLLGYEPSYVSTRAGHPLVSGFRSYQTPTVVRARLSGKGHVWKEEVLPVPFGASPSAPRFERRRLVVSGFTVGGETGQLAVTFYNDRLARVAFRPLDPASAWQASLKDEVPSHSQWPVQVLWGMDMIIVSDSRLSEESVRWCQQYSPEETF